MRKLVFAVAVLILVWAAVVVPLPLLAIQPAPAHPVADIVELRADAGSVPEALLFTAVLVQPQTAAGSVEVWLDEHRELTFTPTVIPPGVEPEDFLELQTRMFEESVRIAAAVGMRAGGADVTISGDGARVAATVPGTSADGVLEQGDVIEAVGDRDVQLASELAAILSAQDPGDQVELTVRRGEEQRTETLLLTELPDGAGPGIGVLASTVDLVIETPVDVRPSAGARVGGPSAGLMIALGVYDATTDADLVRGRTITGTGTIDTSGNVGPVSGVPQKVRAAELAGAEVFLVATDQVDEARDVAPPGLEVVGVADIEEAVAALER